jgi:Na+-driven multidrug efflux pump
MYLGALRAQSRTSLIAFIQGIRGILILGLAFALTGIVGTTGAGIAVLASQVIVAAAVAPSMMSLLRRKPSLSARPIPPTSV